MANLTPQQIAAKWKKNAGNAIDSYKQGIAGVRTAPGELAILQKDRMRQNFNNALDDGTWEERMRAVGLQGWQQAASGKGVANFTTGVNAAENKVVAFQTAWNPLMQEAKERVKTMDKGTEAAALARVAYVMGIGKQFKRNRR